MATGDKLVNLDDLKVAYDKQQEDTNALKSAITFLDNRVNNVYESRNLFDALNYNSIEATISFVVGDSYKIVTGIGYLLVYVKAQPNTKYLIKKNTVTDRFRAGTYPSVPAENVTGTNAVMSDSATSITIETGSSDEYIAVNISTPSTSKENIRKVLDELTITNVDLFQKYDNSAVDNKVRTINGITIENTRNIFNKLEYVVKEAIIDAMIPGDHKITSASGAKTIIVEIKPNTKYVISKETVTSRYNAATYVDFAGNATSYTQNYTGIEMEIVSGANDKYLAVWIKAASDTEQTFNTLINELQIEEFSKTDYIEHYSGVDLIAREKISKLNEYRYNLFDKNNQYYSIKGYIDGVNPGDHKVVENSSNEIVFVKIRGNTSYTIRKATINPRFSCATYTVLPTDASFLNTAATNWVDNRNKTEMIIESGENDVVLAIWLKNPDTTAEAYTAILNSLLVCEGYYAKYISYGNSIPDAIARLQNRTRFTIATWNIGHFSNGASPSTTITEADYEEKRTAFRTLINRIGADIIGLNEYSEVFAFVNGAAVFSSRDLFQNFRIKKLGSQVRYSCNALYSNVPLLTAKQEDYICNQTAVITHTDLVQAKDYYYIESKLSLFGNEIILVTTHCAFDFNNTDVETDQYSELIAKYANYPYVIIMGDFNAVGNVNEFDAFTEAGYTLANHGYIGDMVTVPEGSQEHNRVLDNIIVKGLQMSKIELVETDLSDHYMLKCDLTF